MINVIGLGYIGLPTALSLSANGFEVVGTDCNETLIASLKDSKVTFKENGLEDLFNKAVQKGIIFSKDYISTNMYIVAVATPYKKVNKKIDTSYLVSAIDNILLVCKRNSIIIIESTIPPNTIDKFIRPLIEKRGYVIGEDIHIAHAPERIIPGNMLYELQNNPRVIGVDSEKVGIKVKEIYSSFCKARIIITDIKTAEMIKVVENTYRDINIAFANELAKICSSDNMNVYEVIQIANMHPRVNILQPGPGVGGHCISVDPWFLVGEYPELCNIILTARKVNDSMPEFVLKRIYEIMLENNIKDTSKIGFYGVTYKENVDDIRESPTFQILKSIKYHLGESIKIYDPFIKDDLLENQYCDFETFLNSIDMIVILVSHKHIINNLYKLEKKIIFDTKNICHFKGVYKL